MDRNDRRRARRDRRRRGLRIDQSSGLVDLADRTGVAPACTAPSAEAMKVCAGTITSSPGPMPAARSTSDSADVPDETPTQCAVCRIGEFRLELLDLGSKRVRARPEQEERPPVRLQSARAVRRVRRSARGSRARASSACKICPFSNSLRIQLIPINGGATGPLARRSRTPVNRWCDPGIRDR